MLSLQSKAKFLFFSCVFLALVGLLIEYQAFAERRIILGMICVACVFVCVISAYVNFGLWRRNA